MVNLSKKITPYVNTKKDITFWNTVISDIKESNNLYTVDIGIVEADKYRHDFDGLLLNMGVHPKHLYPHIRVNGYYSGREYNGKKLTIVKIPPDMLDRYTLLKNK